jgi:alkanesulfonate monooxygenase SsuD/methylene tetrahydromethanopterin reductase-like flavin-dependent oxidoreductase (luciferase family)
VTCSPKPVNGNIPILVGGDTNVAINRAVKLAEGYFPGEGDVDRLRALIGRVRAACEAADRDPDSLEINAMFGMQMADPEAGVEQMREAGVGRMMIPAFFFAGPGGLDRMDELAEKIMPLTKG